MPPITRVKGHTCRHYMTQVMATQLSTGCIVPGKQRNITIMWCSCKYCTGKYYIYYYITLFEYKAIEAHHIASSYSGTPEMLAR